MKVTVTPTITSVGDTFDIKLEKDGLEMKNWAIKQENVEKQIELMKSCFSKKGSNEKAN